MSRQIDFDELIRNSKMVDIKLESVGSNNSIWEDMIVQRDSYLKFPVIGRENAVYFETSTNTIWRWDSSSKTYVKAVSDCDFKIIDGSLE